MSDLFKHDNRIEENSALRDLEKKVHWLMYQLSRAGIAVDLAGNKLNIPADCNVADIENDAILVTVDAQQAGVVANSNTLLKNHQRLNNVNTVTKVIDAVEESETTDTDPI